MINLKGVNLYLVGMMGAGKTTTGRLLAAQLGYRFVDTDDLICRLTGQGVVDIFAQFGEAHFRQLETQVLSELAPYTQLVVATGGGIVLDPMNWSYLHHGLVVWLDLPLELLWLRLQCDRSRPLLQSPQPKQVLEDLLDQRRPLYRQADVHLILRDHQTPEQIAQTALQEIGKALKPERPDPQS
ncbi:MAG: shikimate kinase [Acaryochloridaceae cyanobacterium SU_2_1]|nr:shikimate kinase [Acaryochloridaceae cyanobacterium SU_2_1]